MFELCSFANSNVLKLMFKTRFAVFFSLNHAETPRKRCRYRLTADNEIVEDIHYSVEKESAEF